MKVLLSALDLDVDVSVLLHLNELVNLLLFVLFQILLGNQNLIFLVGSLGSGLASVIVIQLSAVATNGLSNQRLDFDGLITFVVDFDYLFDFRRPGHHFAEVHLKDITGDSLESHLILQKFEGQAGELDVHWNRYSVDFGRVEDEEVVVDLRGVPEND